jgi:hypothetical protein
VQSFWNPRRFPDQPKRIRGALDEVGTVVTEPASGKTVTRVRLLVNDGTNEWSVLVAGKVLEDEIAKLRPKVGETIEIEFLGEFIRKGVDPNSPRRRTCATAICGFAWPARSGPWTTSTTPRSASS